MGLRKPHQDTVENNLLILFFISAALSMKSLLEAHMRLSLWNWSGEFGVENLPKEAFLDWRFKYTSSFGPEWGFWYECCDVFWLISQPRSLCCVIVRFQYWVLSDCICSIYANCAHLMLDFSTTFWHKTAVTLIHSPSLISEVYIIREWNVYHWNSQVCCILLLIWMCLAVLACLSIVSFLCSDEGQWMNAYLY